MGRNQKNRPAKARYEKAAEHRRSLTLPKITYPENLPVSRHRDEISQAIRENQVVIIAGETGSGKTTQIPKICLDLGRGREGQIGHTQPRRIAARTVAERIAEELEITLGQTIGYQVRFTREAGKNTLVKVMTDGVLLAEIQRDPMLYQYDTLIIDEAHERSLNIDFLLGYLTQLLPRRPDLKLIITSATIDSERFAKHFSTPAGEPAPVIEVSGRTYPVEVRYRPLAPDSDDATDKEPVDQLTGITEAVDELRREGPGDILVFLSGEREIRDTEEALKDHLTEESRHIPAGRREAIDILPLYSRLSSAEQHRVFQTGTNRRIVLATNVAETSITVPGIRYVIDPGMARISRYAKGTKVQRLPIERISQASANQRSGRCGRVADGIAIRLYSEDDFAARPEFTEPEILRTSLASVILQMISVGIASTPEGVSQFPFVEPPDARNIRDGVSLLHELGAFNPDHQDPKRRLTKTGRQISRIPADPRLARMIVEGARRGVLNDVIVITAALTIQDPRERPQEFQAQADQSHARFADPKSDFVTYLNLWRYLRMQRKSLSGNAFRRLCKSEFINYLRVREWHDLVAQYRSIAADLKLADPAKLGRAKLPTLRPLREGKPPPEGQVATRWEWDAETIHRALLPGLLSHIAMQLTTEVTASPGRNRREQQKARRARNEYLGARGAKIAIFPGSRLSKRPPSWIMASELVETSRLWARDVAAIDPRWVEEQGKHLIKRSYFEPFWSTKQAAACAYERLLLYGLPVISKRRTLLSRYEPELAREMFIRHALVEGEWRTHHTFYHRNADLLAEVEDVENRSRQRGLIADEDTVFDFYDQRIPAHVTSARHFDSWWKKEQQKNPHLLDFTRDFLLPASSELDSEMFPDVWEQRGIVLNLTYQFEPGSAADGVTVHVPITVLDRVEATGFDWLVPGMREELVTELIRSLPKPVRRDLVPAPDAARSILAWIDNQPAGGDDDPYSLSITAAISRAARSLRDVDVPPDAFNLDKLPGHLRITFQVEDEKGTVMGDSKSLTDLQHRLASHSQSAVRSAVRSALHAAMADAEGSQSRPAPTSTIRDDEAAPERKSSSISVANLGDGLLAEQSDLEGWPADLPGDEIPKVVEAEAAGRVVQAYPALVDETEPLPASASEGTVSLRLLSQQPLQAATHRNGVRRLITKHVALPATRITTRWNATESLTLAASPYPNTDVLVADMQLAAVDALLAKTPWTKEDFLAAQNRVQTGLEDQIYRIARDTVSVLEASREVEVAISDNTSVAILNTLTDVKDQHARLIHAGFISRAGAARLPHLARYLQAATHRITKAVETPGRDDSLLWTIHQLEDDFDEIRESFAQLPPNPQRDELADNVRWLIEELRVQTFAQHLPTAQKTSEKRVRKALADLNTTGASS